MVQANQFDSKKYMKIILVCEAVFPENKGGLERWMHWLGKSLSNCGYDVTYFNSKLITETRENVKYKSITNRAWSYTQKGKRSIFRSFVFGFKLFSNLLKSDYDVVYATQAPIISLFFINAANLLKMHKKRILIVEWLEIWSLNYWQSYLGNIIGTFAFLVQNLSLKIGNIKISFTNKISMRLVKSNPRSEILKLPGIIMEEKINNEIILKHRNDIIFLSRFIEEKQPILAIDSVIQFKKSGWQGIFNIIGTGPLLAEIREYIISKKAESYIKIYVNISDQEVKEKFTKSFVLLHTSRREGFGLSIVEAAVQGVPQILLNYDENLSTELAIVPDLICDSFKFQHISDKLKEAYSNQEKYFYTVQNWLEKRYPDLLGTTSVSIIDRRIRSILG